MQNTILTTTQVVVHNLDGMRVHAERVTGFNGRQRVLVRATTGVGESDVIFAGAVDDLIGLLGAMLRKAVEVEDEIAGERAC